MRIFFILGVLFSLSACVSAKKDKTIVNGQEAYRIFSVYTSPEVYPASEARKKVAYQELVEGSKWARLPAKAKKVCSKGYNIVKRNPPVEESYLISSIPAFHSRFIQEFFITCK